MRSSGRQNKKINKASTCHVAREPHVHPRRVHRLLPRPEQTVLSHARKPEKSRSCQSAMHDLHDIAIFNKHRGLKTHGSQPSWQSEESTPESMWKFMTSAGRTYVAITCSMPIYVEHVFANVCRTTLPTIGFRRQCFICKQACRSMHSAMNSPECPGPTM